MVKQMFPLNLSLCYSVVVAYYTLLQYTPVFIIAGWGIKINFGALAIF